MKMLFSWLTRGKETTSPPVPKPGKEPTWEEVFQRLFCFPSVRLAEHRFKKEALLRLAALAKAVAMNAAALDRLPLNPYIEVDYKESFRRYNAAFDLLEHFAPDLAAQIPHWTELPAFLKDWLAGEPLDEKFTVKAAEPTFLTVAP